MHYVRAHAARFGVDPEQIISMGGSAGGQLAAAVAIENGWDDDQDDLSVSPQPQAMVLFNPVLDLIGEMEKRGVTLLKHTGFNWGLFPRTNTSIIRRLPASYSSGRRTSSSPMA